MPGLTGANTKPNPYQTQFMFAVADPPATWTNQNASGTTPIGVSISEPMPASGTYYQQPTVKNPQSGLYDAYGDLTEGGGTKFPDQPFEEPTALIKYPNFPLNKDVGMSATRTNQCYKVIFLQRLADPTSGWDKLRNPYITVDWMPIDLTVFNGDAVPDSRHPNPNDAAATPSAKTGVISINFASRQRGGSNPNAGITPTNNLWSMVPPSNPSAGVTIANDLPQSKKFTTGTTPDNIPIQLIHTLGYLNQGFGVGMANAGQSPLAQYVGDPPQPFPWIDWNARPYASPMELLNVPASSPERLLFEFNSPGSQVYYGPKRHKFAADTDTNGESLRTHGGNVWKFSCHLDICSISLSRRIQTTRPDRRAISINCWNTCRCPAVSSAPNRI